MDKANREDLVFISKVCEEAERYDDMVGFMKQVAQMEPPLSIEERNLLSVAFKNGTF